jgi:uncharacterized protein with PIN domain
MVRIIGEAPEAMKITVCRNCATRLEYTQSEVKEYHGVDYSGGPDGREWIDCPKCHKEVVLKSW